jgi:hypothetical protein
MGGLDRGGCDRRAKHRAEWNCGCPSCVRRRAPHGRIVQLEVLRWAERLRSRRAQVLCTVRDTHDVRCRVGGESLFEQAGRIGMSAHDALPGVRDRRQPLDARGVSRRSLHDGRRNDRSEHRVHCRRRVHRASCLLLHLQSRCSFRGVAQRRAHRVRTRGLRQNEVCSVHHSADAQSVLRSRNQALRALTLRGCAKIRCLPTRSSSARGS